MSDKKAKNPEKSDKKDESASKKYEEKPQGAVSAVPEGTKIEEKQLEKFEKLREKMEDFRKSIIKKYAFTMALGILPPNASAMFEEEEGVPKEAIESKPIHLIMIIPEEQYENIQKIKPEVIKLVKEIKENFWVHIKTPIDIWNYGLDSKFEFVDAISASFPIYDNGFLGALRVANIHKTLLLRKFEKYVTSYVIAGRVWLIIS